MNVILSQKDADFVLAYLRADLEILNRKYDEASEKEASISNMFEENPELHDNKFATKLYSDVKEFSDKIASLYREKSDIILKCIELLTIGSEVE